MENLGFRSKKPNLSPNMRAMTSLMIDFFNMLINAEPDICRLRFFILLLQRQTKTTQIMKPNVKIIRIIVSVLIAALTALGAAIGLNSCNVVRTITNKSEYYQRGDTSVMIQTKTTESYDATKH